MNEATVNGGAIVRQEFGATSIERVHETAQASMAAQARAAIEAMFVVARANPRSWDQVRVKLLEECKRPAFAKAAWFRKPQGNTFIEGLSVRFAETALRIAGNLRRGTRTTFESERARQINVFVVDCETNSESSRDITIEKTVERKNNKGRLVLQQRTNSAGDPVFIVAATADEMMMQEGAIISKVGRVLILQMIPGDILDDCREQIQKTRANDDAKDPSAARKALADAFASLSVMPADLAKYLGHDIAQCTPVELDDLRSIYAAVRDGEASWLDVLAAKGGPGDQVDNAAGGSEPHDTKPTTRGARLAKQARANTAPSDTAVTTTPATSTPPAQQQATTQTAPAAATPAASPSTGTKPGAPIQQELGAAAPVAHVGGHAIPLKPGETPVASHPVATSTLNEQVALASKWPSAIGIPVIVHLAGGDFESFTTTMARVQGDIAVVNVDKVDGPVSLNKVTRIG
jgi:hypothetical protein